MPGNCVAGLVEQDAVIANAEAEQPLKLAAERLNSSPYRLRRSGGERAGCPGRSAARLRGLLPGRSAENGFSSRAF